MNNITDSCNIEIIVTGDFCPTGHLEHLCLEEKYDEIYNDVFPYLLDKDLSITNLECPLTTTNNPIKKIGPVLSANPKCIEAIKYGGFNVATLSNNHILDQNENGLIETLETCSKKGIKIVGAGKNLNEASKPLFIVIKSKKIAIINITENEFSIATSDKAGANPLNLIANYKQIKQTKENSDYILLILHGGNEHYNLPSPGMVERCHFFAEVGVNAVICHHTHCSSGYEIYKGVPIFYSLGNFLFERRSSNSEQWNEGYFVKLNINNNSFSLHPYFQNKNKIGLKYMQGEDKSKFLNHIEKLSLIIKDGKQLSEEWKSYCNAKEYYYLTSLFTLNKIQKFLYRNGIIKSMIIKNRNITSLYNKISCEAHREASLEILNNKIIND